MGSLREIAHKKPRMAVSMEMPLWLSQADALPDRKFITGCEKKLVDLIRKHGEVTKAGLVSSTDYSRTKITSCIDSLLDKQVIIANSATEYSGGRRSKTFSLNGQFGLVCGIDIGATSIDLGIADFSGKLLVRYAEPASVKDGPIKVLGRVCTLLESLLKENNLTPRRCTASVSAFPARWILPPARWSRRRSCRDGMVIRSSRPSSSGFQPPTSSLIMTST